MDENALRQLAGKLLPEPEHKPTIENQKPDVKKEAEIAAKTEESPLPTDEIDVAQLAADLHELLEKRGLQQTEDVPITTTPLNSPLKLRQEIDLAILPPATSSETIFEPSIFCGPKMTECLISSRTAPKSGTENTPMRHVIRECRVILNNFKDSDFYKNSISEEMPQNIPEMDGKRYLKKDER